MNTWCHLPTGFKFRRILQFAVFVSMIVALTTTLIFAHVSTAAPGTSKTINFQGRLLNATGAVIPDGHYNIQFKIYQDGAGAATGNPGGTLKWTESYVNNNSDNGVEVKNGFFSVSLGSLNPFGTSVDWNQDTLWLSMNVASSATGCTTFGSTPCVADGEMLPMKRITATPYALNSGTVGGKSADELTQLGQGVQTDTSSNSSIFINKTGSGNLLQLQAGGADAFTLNTAGSITMGSIADQSLTVATSSSGAGKSLAVRAGAAASNSDLGGGDLVIQGGAGDGTGKSGNVIVKANDTDATGTFQVQNADGEALLNVDTVNGIVTAGNIKLASGSSGSGVSRSLWGSETPASVGSFNDADKPITVGTTFKSDMPGTITGVRYYNPGGGNPSGADLGKLWACNSATCELPSGGAQLASVTFPADSSAGWKTATFNTPITISPDTYYIVTHYSSNGQYAATSHYFDNDYHNAPLHALGAGTTTNGSFAMESTGFPSSTFGNTGYWVDIVFQPADNVDQISTDNDLQIISGGTMTLGSTGHDLKLQGSSIDIGATNGGNVTIQGGDAVVSNGNGGSLILSGGLGTGTGANGLVILSTPTFSTVTNDANCYTSGAPVASNCTVAASTVNSASAVLVGFNAANKTATLPNPINTTAGRILYVMAASGSQTFTLRANAGEGEGIEQNIVMRQNSTATMLWNGSAWTVADGSGSTTLQNAYDNTLQSGDTAEIVVNKNGSTDGLTIRDSANDPVDGTLLSVQTASAASLFSVNNTSTNLATDGGAETAGASATAFPTGTWDITGTSSVSRHVMLGDHVASGQASVKAVPTAADSGIANTLSTALTTSATYNVSLSARLESGSFTDLEVLYSNDGSSTPIVCKDNVILATNAWTKVTCSFQAPPSGITAQNAVIIRQAGAATRTFYVDNLSVTLASSAAPNVQVGGGQNGGPTTLFTVDKSDSAPVAADSEALLGSMYYDTTVGKLQCYEASGWGSCGASPDNFVTLSPEYANAVIHGTDLGTMSSDLCSDALNINDGSSSQPTVCGTNETHNFYKWTSEEVTDQTRSIFVTYQLPASFKEFVADSTSLTGRTDSTDSAITYQVYRNHNGTGLTACGSTVSVATGVQSSWQKVTATDTADPANCNFSAGDSIVFRINLTTKNDANAYVSNLGFVFSTH